MWMLCLCSTSFVCYHVLDKYSMLVDGRSAGEVHEFLESNRSFDEYTLVSFNNIKC